MASILSNNDLEVQIDLPHENYQCSRFDWTGKISSVKFQGISMTTNEKKIHPNIHLQGRGLYNEFDIQGPSDFEKTKLGDDFEKIGIGSLNKVHPQYDFLFPYPIKPAKFDHYCSNNQVSLTCQSDITSNLSYTLKKNLLLKENQLIIDYELSNTGQRLISTREYTHNFLCIDNDPIGPNYLLEFSFHLNDSSLDERVNPEQEVILHDQLVSFNSNPNEAFYFSNLSGGIAVHAQWILRHQPSNISISETASFNSTQINLWGMGHVISPELIQNLLIEPMQHAHWTRIYSFSTIH